MGKIGFDYDGGTSVEEVTETVKKTLPMWNVVILNDDDHTFDYVIEMLNTIFEMEVEKAFMCALTIDKEGRCIVCTTTKERAELKQDQVHSFGKDIRIYSCSGSMSCIIEPAE